MTAARSTEETFVAEQGWAGEDGHEEVFTAHRPLLFAIAYRMLGGVADAEDAVQETYLRWRGAVADGTPIASSKAWLSSVVTRLCIDVLRSARVQRESYVGPWLAEPMVTAGEREPDVADAAVLAESLSLAFLVLLETLTPTERAVFLLHDVFAYEYAEIAAIVGETAVNCRQLARRARTRVAERRPRFRAAPEQQEHLTAQFVQACADGDLDALLATLAGDVVLWSDGGGKARAATRPIHGADGVARFVLGSLRNAPAGIVSRMSRVNGQSAVIAYLAGQPFAVITLDIAADGIRAVTIVVNPDKLRAVPPADADGE